MTAKLTSQGSNFGKIECSGGLCGQSISISKLAVKYIKVIYSCEGQKATVQINRESGDPAWNIYLTFEGYGNVIAQRILRLRPWV
ncbi:hypothetical protein LZD49_33715 [Dyadobacter sp. CY261]|uniref:hypothetical protein n=1 Tax=Dyadobacter sp. CY261 TaxID=2907203 RepID=UPI001F3C42CF|nr:hypothetical protein [Dyadobacter sp. CY261]MCF0075485.1 hypothetical protein [Dyadobacter sp. CY261]